MLTRNTSYKRHTVTAANDTANTVELTFTEIVQIGAVNVMILRAGKVVSSDPAVSISGNKLTVADGSSYTLTANDVIHAIAIEGA
jgi:hypothetical protein